MRALLDPIVLEEEEPEQRARRHLRHLAARPPAGVTRRAAFIAGLSAAGCARGAFAQSGPAIPLRVAHVAVADAVPFEYALQQSWFAQAGLDVQATLLSSGSAAATAVVGGAVDIGSSNLFTAVLARAKGLPVVIIAPGGRYEDDLPTSQLLVAADSPIKTGQRSRRQDGGGGRPQRHVVALGSRLGNDDRRRSGAREVRRDPDEHDDGDDQERPRRRDLRLRAGPADCTHQRERPRPRDHVRRDRQALLHLGVDRDGTVARAAP